MLTLSPETLRLAERLAAEQGVSLDEAVRRAIEESARAAGVQSESEKAGRRRLTIEQMLAVGAEIASKPLFDERSPSTIADDLNTR